MKFRLLIMGLSLYLFVNTVQAQKDYDDLREDLTIGLKAGINYSNVWDEEGGDFKADVRVRFEGAEFNGVNIEAAISS